MERHRAPYNTVELYKALTGYTPKKDCKPFGLTPLEYKRLWRAKHPNYHRDKMREYRARDRNKWSRE